ncbi:MAG: malectin domain-containing carbohydrate-binding protein [Anaerolineae bacterium]
MSINAGSSGYTGSRGETWAADESFDRGHPASTANPIGGTPDPTLYQSERYGYAFTYTVPVTNGTYQVTLKFAEIFWAKPGQRVFDVTINEQMVLDNFDILSQVAPNTALDKTYNVKVTDGSIRVAFTSVKDMAKIAAIQILPADAVVAPVIVAAGDIACDPEDRQYNGGSGTAAACRQRATSDLIRNIGPTAVLALGDNQYEDGTLDEYMKSYDPTWGRFKSITYPATGNHEYRTPEAKGYFDYFGSVAGFADKGYYSVDIGTWHIIALNSTCDAVGGCKQGSPQERWLRADLAAHRSQCTLAFWHHPLFTSSPYGNDWTSHDLWQALYDAGADVVLNGHAHIYERLGPVRPDGTADPVKGIREFIVGSGGESHYEFGTILAASEARTADTFGILKLTLRPGGYDWEFVPEAGGAFHDSGSGQCH